MDYEVFLVSGMREEYVKTGNARSAITRGFAHSSRVVTAAALIMFFVFFAFVPEGSGMIKPIALGLAAGIAFDAFLVRMTLGPALMALMGKAAWWMPRWLGRLLPNMDIEGEHLRAHLDGEEWASKQHRDGVTTDQLIVGVGTGPSQGEGHDASSPAPISVSVPRGGVLLVSGAPAYRRLFAATIAGRLAMVSGQAQVAGHPLDSEREQVARRVAMITVSGADRAVSDPTIGELLTERLSLTLPWYRAWRSRREAVLWLRRVGDILGEPIEPSTHVQHLPRHARAVALACVALAEQPRVVMIDLSGVATIEAELDLFLSHVGSLAPDGTTIVITGAFSTESPTQRPTQTPGRSLGQAADNSVDTTTAVISPSRTVVRLNLAASVSRAGVQEGATA